MFSKTCEYGIRAMIYIANQSQKGTRVSLQDVAQEIDSPVAFTAKILQSLSKSELIVSVKGAGGGYHISEEAITQINLHQIVLALDGDQLFTNCGLGLKACNEHKPCPLHHQFKAIRSNLIETLCGTTIGELASNLNLGTSFLKV